MWSRSLKEVSLISFKVSGRSTVIISLTIDHLAALLIYLDFVRINSKSFLHE